MPDTAASATSKPVQVVICPECGTRAGASRKQAIRAQCSKWVAWIVLLLGLAAFLTATIMTSKFDSGHMQDCSSPNIDELKVRVDDLRQYAVSDNPPSDLVRGVVQQIQARGGQPLDPYMVDLDFVLKVSASFGGSQYALPSRAIESIGWPVGAAWKTSRDPSSSANTFPSPGELVIGPFEISIRGVTYSGTTFQVGLTLRSLVFLLGIFVVADKLDGWLNQFAASGIRCTRRTKRQSSVSPPVRRRGRLTCHAAVGVLVALQFVASYQQVVMPGASGSSWTTSNYGVSTLHESDFRNAARLDDPQWRRDVYTAMVNALPHPASSEIVRLSWERNVQFRVGETLLVPWFQEYVLSYQMTKLPKSSSASTSVVLGWDALSMSGPIGSARDRWIQAYVNIPIVLQMLFGFWLLFKLTRLLQWLVAGRRIKWRVRKMLCMACGYPLPKPRDIAVIAT